MKIKSNPKIETFDSTGKKNGYLIPVFNINDGFNEPDKIPQQAYITSIAPGASKGPHLHYVRTGCFTCIKGNCKIVIRDKYGKYFDYYSGEEHQYQTVIIPTGTPALLINLSINEEALILNMPSPAWTAQMNDEYNADFSDYESKK